MRKLSSCCTDTGVVEPGTPLSPLESAEQIAAREEDYKKFLASAKQNFNEKYAANKVQKKSIEDFKISGQLSQGHFGVVVKAKYNPDKTTCAIKVLHKEDLVKGKQVQNVIQEKKILQALDCPFVVKLLYVGHDFPNVYLMMECAPYGDLSKNGKNQTDAVVKHFAAQLVLALEYLHTCNIIYRDLKPKNVLLFEDGLVKLGDFGLAKVCEGQTSTFCGDVSYCAPEILSKKPYGTKIDWWALGVTLHDLLVGDLPFPGVGDADQIKRIRESEFTPPPNIDASLQDLLTKLLLKDPAPRLGNILNGEVDVKKHPYFKDIVCVHLINGMKRIRLPKMSAVKPKDVDQNKLIPELMTDPYRDQFKDFC